MQTKTYFSSAFSSQAYGPKQDIVVLRIIKICITFFLRLFLFTLLLSEDRRRFMRESIFRKTDLHALKRVRFEKCMQKSFLLFSVQLIIQKVKTPNSISCRSSGCKSQAKVNDKIWSQDSWTHRFRQISVSFIWESFMTQKLSTDVF